MLIFLGLTSKLTIAENTNLECSYRFTSDTGDYECVIEGVRVVDDESQNFVISGSHLENKTDVDVVVFRVTNSEVPFIITQAFSTFPNLEQYVAWSSGLKRIQSNAIRNAPKLFNFLAHINPNFTTIHSNAFSGGSMLRDVFLQRGNISEIHSNAFVGLNNVRSLGFSNNRIRNLPKNLFRPLPRLSTVFLSHNLLEILDSNMFSHNPRMHQLMFSGNKITAIDRNFLKSTPFVNFWFLQNNECINFNILFGWQPESRIQQELRPCFENFDNLHQ